eukprot:NODE_704_length_4999_cov_0.292653.p1 type:complete len:433 gc:universal NODE_704_length_4999_cov_0.292653:3519-2221(-)
MQNATTIQLGTSIHHITSSSDYIMASNQSAFHIYSLYSMANVRKINIQSIVHDYYENGTNSLTALGTEDGAVFLYNDNKRMKTFQFYSKIQSIEMNKLDLLVGTKDTIHFTNLLGDVTWKHELENEMIYRLNTQDNMIVSCGYMNLQLLDSQKNLIWKSEHGKEWRQCIIDRNSMYTANEHYIKLWDTRYLKNEVSSVITKYSVGKHTKPISEMCMTKSQIVTGGLDQSIKWFDKDLRLINSVKTVSPILGINADYDEKWVAVGLVNGMIRKYTKQKEHKKAKKTEQLVRVSNPNETIYKPVQRKQLKPHELALQRFRYAAAVDLALTANDFWNVMVLIESQDALRQALTLRTVDSIKPILLKCLRSLSNNSKYELLCIKCVSILNKTFPPHNVDFSIRDSYAKIAARLKQLSVDRKLALELKSKIDFIMAQ